MKGRASVLRWSPVSTARTCTVNVTHGPVAPFRPRSYRPGENTGFSRYTRDPPAGEEQLTRGTGEEVLVPRRPKADSSSQQGQPGVTPGLLTVAAEGSKKKKKKMQPGESTPSLLGHKCDLVQECGLDGTQLPPQLTARRARAEESFSCNGN